jgi:nitrogen regulatory protein PII
MKIVRGFVREAKVNEIVQALEAIGASGLTVMKAHGRGSDTPMGIYRGVPYPALKPMCVIDVITSDSEAEDIARVMLDGARTGHPGDGHVCVFNVEETYAVRTHWPRVA